MTKLLKSTAFAVAAIGLLLAVNSTASADEKGKGTDAKPSAPGLLTIDTSKLPSELLKELLKYSKEGKKADSKQAANPEKPGQGKPESVGKGKPAWATPGSGALPPGLAKKAKNHPGVIAFLKRAEKSSQPEPMKKGKGNEKKKDKKKKKGKDKKKESK